MKDNKKVILFILTIIVLISLVWFFGYMSEENKIRRLQGQYINDWYFSGISINRKSIDEMRSADERVLMERLRKASFELGDEWSYLYEDLTIKHIDEYSQIIEITFVFKNSNGNNQFFIKRYYYSFLDTDQPILLSSKSFIKDTSDKISNTITRTLWEGDFDAICIKPN